MTGTWLLALGLAALLGAAVGVGLWFSRPTRRFSESWGWTLPTYLRPPDAPDFSVRSGQFEALAQVRLGTVADTVELRTRSGITHTISREGGETSGQRLVSADPETPSALPDVSDIREALYVAAPAAALTGMLTVDTIKSAAELDSSLLNAMTQLSGEQIDGLADFRNFQAMDGYQLDSYKLRGGVGEQESAEGFESLGHDVSWPEGGATEFGPSNNPGWDLAVDGHHVNVKVVADASDAAAQHFAKYPEIPLVVNSDAANIPDDAVYVDATTDLLPEDLIGDNIVIVQEALTLSGAEGIQSAASDAVAPIDLDGASDALPGLGLLIAGVRSGVREGRLLANGKTRAGRAVKNVALDTAGRGGGGLAGLAAGTQAGLAIDASMGGMGLGIPTLVLGTAGTILGALAGGKAANSVKAIPLKDAQTSLTQTLMRYNVELSSAHSKAMTTIRKGRAHEHSRHAQTCGRIQLANQDLLGELQNELTRASSLTCDQATSMVAAATEAVAAAEDAYCLLADRPGLRRRMSKERATAVSRARAWRSAADASLQPSGSGTADLAAVMDVVMAAPGGEQVAADFIGSFEATQQEVRRMAFAGNSVMLKLVDASSQQAILRLQHLREETEAAAALKLQPFVTKVTRARNKVWRELEQAGKR